MLTGWRSIAPERPFLDDLARELLVQFPKAGELSAAIILLPTGRAARELAHAFLVAGGGRPLLLPQIRALGDLDEGEPPFEPGDAALELPPAIGSWRRRFELAGVVHAAAGRLRRTLDTPAALAMADALAGFLDSLQIEGVDPRGRLEALAAGDHAEHWRRSTEVLEIALELWPQRLHQLGLIDLTERRARLLNLLADRWSSAPPDRPLIAAGSTGAQPATARLLAAVAAAPQGLVVLPGLDLNMPDAVWDAVEDQHPQSAMRRLLQGAGVTRAAVQPWPSTGGSRGRWRTRLVSEALRPAETTADWLDVIGKLREGQDADPAADGLKGLRLIEAAEEEQAACVCALLLREALETDGATAALVTPDLGLARRVSAHLTRWGVSADSTAGQALATYPAAALALALLRRLSDPEDPIPLLEAIKHPLARLGLDEQTLDQGRAELERHALRGPRPRDMAEVERRLAKAEKLTPEGRADALAVAQAAETAIAHLHTPFAAGDASVPAAARGLAISLEAIARGTSAWGGAGGECLSNLIAALIEDSGALPPVSPNAFAAMTAALIAAETVRPQAASHPRLRIMGVLEARLVRADHMILAGLEEEVWPRAAPADPFLSRPMREQLGLPSPERRIGLSAHDFAQAACSPQVTLVTAKRRGGAPAVESRWLWRLRTLARGAGLEIEGRPDIVAAAKALGRVPGKPAPAERPRPTPPIEARPNELPVTAVERWLRDPYETYAKYVLKLRPLDPPDLAIGPRHRGTAIHEALERFTLDHGGALPEEAERLIALGLEDALLRHGLPQARLARERVLMTRVAPWIVAFEQRRRPGARILVEQQGRLPMGDFTLTARADRLEVRGDRVDILDFKTGKPPTVKQVEGHLAIQLTLTAAILGAGGFTQVGQARPGQLLYVRVNGGRTIGEETPATTADAGALGAEALARLMRRVEAFGNQTAGYLSRAMPMKSGETGDYDHLARVLEWSADGGEAGEE